MNKIKLSAVLTFVATAVFLFLGHYPACAETTPSPPKGTQEAADTVAKKATDKRAEAIKKRRAAQESIRQIIEGQYPDISAGPADSRSGDVGKGGSQ